ncbi:hypothetical protein CHS0354_040891, partial [Potamilus streckersoni]
MYQFSSIPPVPNIFNMLRKIAKPLMVREKMTIDQQYLAFCFQRNSTGARPCSFLPAIFATKSLGNDECRQTLLFDTNSNAVTDRNFPHM